MLEQGSEGEWWMRELERKRGKEEGRVGVGVWSVANVCVLCSTGTLGDSDR